MRATTDPAVVFTAAAVVSTAGSAAITVAAVETQAESAAWGVGSARVQADSLMLDCRRREPYRPSGPRGGHGVLPAVSADARQARSADPSEGGRGGLLPGGAEPRPRPQPAGGAPGRRPRVPGVPVRPGQQHDRDVQRRLEDGLLRQALPLLAGRRSVRWPLRRQRHAVLQHAAADGDGLDGLSLSAAVQPARPRGPLLGVVLPAQRGVLLRLLDSARGLQHVLGGGVPLLRPAADRRDRPAGPPPGMALRPGLGGGAGARRLRQADVRRRGARAALGLWAGPPLEDARRLDGRGRRQHGDHRGDRDPADRPSVVLLRGPPAGGDALRAGQGADLSRDRGGPGRRRRAGTSAGRRERRRREPDRPRRPFRVRRCPIRPPATPGRGWSALPT